MERRVREKVREKEKKRKIHAGDMVDNHLGNLGCLQDSKGHISGIFL